MDSPIAADATRDAPRPSPQYRRNNAALVAEVRDGLSRRHRELPRRFLDDRAVADIRRTLEAIANDHLQRTEVPLLRTMIRQYRARRAIRRVVEVAPGGSSSILALLDAPADHARIESYLAIDRSIDPAVEAVQRVANTDPHISAIPVTTDPTLTLPVRQSSGTIFACLGRALSQLTTVPAIRMLRAIRAAMTLDDRLLVSLDLRDAATRIAATTDHTEFLTQWHRHALAVTNRDVGADFPLDHFYYCSRLDAENSRIEEGVACTGPTRIVCPGMNALLLRAGDHIRTVVDCLYDRAMLQSMLRGVGLSLEQWTPSTDGTRALASAIVRFPDDGMP